MNRQLARKAFEASLCARRLAEEASRATGAERILLKGKSLSQYEKARSYRMAAMGMEVERA